MTEINTRT